MNSKKIFSIIIGLALPILVFYVYRKSYGYIYHSIDDVVINYALLKQEVVLLPYVGIVLSNILGGIQAISGNVNVFFIFLITSYCISFSIFIYLVNILKNTFIKCMLVITLLTIEFLTIKYFTYSVIAYLLATAGILLLLKENKNIIAIILIFLGISLRPQIIVSLIILLLPIFVYELIKNKNYKKIIVVFSICFIVAASNKVYTIFDKTTDAYLKWNEKSTLIRDYPSIDYDFKKEILEKNDISQNDLNSYNSWIFAEKDIFDNNFLNKLDNSRSLKEKYNFSIKNIILEAASNNFIKVILFFDILLLLFYRVKNIYGYSIMLTPLILFFALIIRQRLVERIYIPIIVIFLVIVIIYFDQFYRKRQFKLLANTETAIFGLSCLLLLNYSISYGKNNLYWFTKNTFEFNKHYNSEINSNPDLLYIFVGYGNLISSQPNTAKIFPKIENISSNITTLGNWQTFSKQYFKELNQLKIANADNLLSESVNNEKIKFIMPEESSAEIYIKNIFKEHYNRNVYFMKEKNLPEKIGIYSLRGES